MNPRLASLKQNEAELNKCKESPLYFFNTYVLKEGEQPLIQEQYDRLVKEMEALRNVRPIRMRYNNFGKLQLS